MVASRVVKIIIIDMQVDEGNHLTLYSLAKSSGVWEKLCFFYVGRQTIIESRIENINKLVIYCISILSKGTKREHHGYIPS